MYLILFILSLLLNPKPSLALDEFLTTQTTKYDIQNNGTAHVKQLISIKNNFSEIYPKEYSVSLSGSVPTNISANKNNQNILKNYQTIRDSTKINLEFINPAIGKDKETIFEINYDLISAAEKKGNTWELIIPQNNKQGGRLEIITPTTFGKVSYSSVKNINVNYFPNKTQINVDKLPSSKILIIFGNYQLFDFKLKYYLDNPSSELVSTEIPIPPETDSQKIIIQSIDPPPLNTIIDEDGNWLAQYYLEANQKIEVNINGQIKVLPQNVSKEVQSFLPQHTKSDLYWPSTDKKITEISSRLKTVRNIYDYVINKLSYNYDSYDQSVRKGALAALDNPNESVCTEFTDLFITLSRSLNIPAREIEGYAYTNNKKLKPISNNADVLHAWPQYFDTTSQRWISIDPTWEKTTNGIDYFRDLDLNHITFVIHGISSQYPPPPGSYKDTNDSKTVFIDYAKNEISTQNIKPTLSFTNNSLFKTNNLRIYNPNQTAINKLNIVNPQLELDIQINQIPPFSYVEIPIKQITLPKILSPRNKTQNFLITSAESSDQTNIDLKYPPYYLYTISTFSILIIILCLGGIIITSKRK